MTSFALSFLSVSGSTWCVFLTNSPISLIACVEINTPFPPLSQLLTALHVHYSLYEFSHHTMYGTVSTLLDSCCGCHQGIGNLHLVGLQWISWMFLKPVSADPCLPQRGESVFWETKMRNGGRVLLAVLNFYARITISVATLGSNHDVTDSPLTVNR